MAEAFFTVGKQVLTLFLLMGVGFGLGKTKLLDEKGSVSITNLVMYIVLPSMLIVAFQREVVVSDLRDFGVAILLALAVHGVAILCATLCFRKGDSSRRAVLRFAAVFSNCGFLGYPLMSALLGDVGVFYGSAYVAVFTVLSWTWGLYTMTGDRTRLSVRRVLLTPGIIGVVLALGLYLLRIRLPQFMMPTMSYLSGMNTPLPTIVVGYQLSQANIRAALRGRDTWAAMLLRLVVLPLAALGICLALGVSEPVALVSVIAAATPAAALLSMFTVKFGGDTHLASSIVSVQTLVGVATMPLIVGLAKYLCG